MRLSIPMPKKAVEYIIQRQEQYEKENRKRSSPDYQRKRLILIFFLLVVINVMYMYCVVPERSMPSLWRIISNFKRLGVLQLSCNFQKGGVQTKNPLYEEYGYFPEQHFFKYKQIETDSYNCRSAKKIHINQNAN